MRKSSSIRTFTNSLLMGLRAFICVLSCYTLVGTVLSTRALAFEPGATVSVYIDSDSFYEHGFPDSFTEENLKIATLKVIDNWMQITGANINLNLVDTDFEEGRGAHKNEIVINAKLRSPSSALAIANVGANASLITFYRYQTSGEKATEVSWDVFPLDAYPSRSFTGVLMHEMGHALGLEHNFLTPSESVMSVHISHQLDWGPYRQDIEDMVALYGKRPADPIKVMQSTDQGLTWQKMDSEIDSDLSSTMPLSVSRDDDRMVIFYRDINNRPAWISGPLSGSSFKNANSSYIAGGNQSLYGVAGHGYDNEYMMAWVDMDLHIRVTSMVGDPNGYDVDIGAWRLPSSYNTTYVSGTPAIHKLAADTWILTYPKLNPDISENFPKQGHIVSRISTDDGLSWSDEVELFPELNYRAMRGVSVTSNGPHDIRIVFSNSSNSVDGNLGAGAIATISARLIKKDNLVAKSTTTNVLHPTATDVTATKTAFGFVLGNRDFSSEAVTRNATPDSIIWDNPRTPVSPERVRVVPSVVARRNSSWAFLFYTSLESDFPWINSDSPNASGDWETLSKVASDYPQSYCSNPSRVDARVVGSEYIYTTASGFPDNLARFNAKDGLVCKKADQADNTCNDYSVRFLCEGVWTQWYNRDSPGGTADSESTKYFDDLCSFPTVIQAQTTVSGQTVTAYGPPDRLLHFSTDKGLACRHEDQPDGKKCNDYAVRLICP